MLLHLLAPVLPRAANSLGIPRTVERGVALTFDDGPHPEGTPAVLELLGEAKVRATFFMVGEQVERRPELAAEVAACGHEVALHAYHHRLQSRMTKRQLAEDIDRGLRAIEAATNRRPTLHRPPYGVYSPAGLDTVRNQALMPLLWSRWGRDWRKHTTPQKIATRVMRGLAGGDVILLHDGDFYSAAGSHRRTVEALEIILKALKEREIGTVLPV
jgi:peptidoglycan/xylan/chitin deacetylase (PgdA/CDA1 family)